jgi:hypothetical protein
VYFDFFMSQLLARRLLKAGKLSLKLDGKTGGGRQSSSRHVDGTAQMCPTFGAAIPEPASRLEIRYDDRAATIVVAASAACYTAPRSRLAGL